VESPKHGSVSDTLGASSKSPSLPRTRSDPSLKYGSVAASVAILAGIAATDAACCKELGKRSRSDNHHDAELLLEQITPGGKRAVSQLRQLIDIKDTAHYGFIDVSAAQLKRALRQARHLAGFAEEIVRR